MSAKKEDTPERLARREYDKQRYQTNLDRRAQVMATAKWNRMLRNFGVTREQWEIRFEAQGRRCACCQRDLGDGFRACLDHDHVTKGIRGIVCFDCNTSIGKLGDNVEGLTRALGYVRGPQPFPPGLSAGLLF